MEKKMIFAVLLLFMLQGLFFIEVSAQGVIPPHHYSVPKLLDRTATATSFAYSLRKLKNAYSGYAVRIRLGISSAEADVAFDSTNIVSVKSNVTVTAVGTSGLSNGQVLRYAAFTGAQTVYVKTWYDQGATGYNAIQTTAGSQPTLVLNSAGGSNTKPSLLFTGTQYLDVGQPIQNIVNNGINGSFLLWTKAGGNAIHTSFGNWQSTSAPNWRWSLHMNYSDGRCYFDAAEVCCATNRSFTNAANVSVYKQYSFVRGSSYKTVNINSVATSLNNSAAASTSSTGGSFYIGWAYNAAAPGYSGNLSECVMFPTDLGTANLLVLETDQITYWSN